jgi:nucleobase:cation symporter-1, NCS1 family
MAEQEAGSIYGRDALEAVPSGKRDFNWVALAFIFMGMQVPVSYFITGGSVIAGLPLGEAFAIPVVAAAIGFLLFALVGIMGWQTGTSTMVCTRPAFGIIGSVLPALVTWIELTGWDSVHVQLAGKLMGTIAQPAGLSYPRLYSVGVGLIIAGLVIWGHRILKVMERLLVPIVIVLVALALYTVLHGQNLAHLWSKSRPGNLTVMLGFDAMFIAILTWVPMVSDYTRFARSRSGAFWPAWLASLPVALFMLFVGQAGAVGLNNPNALVAMVNTGGVFSILAFCIATFATIATAALIMYSASMAGLNVLSTFFPGLQLRHINMFTGVIVIVASITINLLGNVINWLTFQGALLIPLFAVLLVDYFLLRGRHYAPAALFGRKGPYWGKAGFNPVGYAAWVVGAIVYLIASHELRSIGGSVLSFVAAGLVHYVAGKLWYRRAEVPSADAPAPQMPAQAQ